jgi:hypothetical protein
MKGAVVIVDATGSSGRAAVEAALRAERPVIAVSPDASALAHLAASHPDADLTVVVGSGQDDASGAQLAARLRQFDRPLAGVIVASCREPARGRVLDQSSAKLRRTLDDELLPQLIYARELIPLLAQAGRNGRYVVIGGPGSEQPWAGYGLRSVAAVAARMLIRVLHDEARALGVRVQLLAVDLPARTDDNCEHACSQWPSAAAIGASAVALVDQLETRTPAEAVVRHAQDVRLAPAQPITPPPAARRRTPHSDPPRDVSPLPDLDDTWALLKPFLDLNSNKESTP